LMPLWATLSMLLTLFIIPLSSWARPCNRYTEHP